MSGFHRVLFFISDILLLNISIFSAFYFWDITFWISDKIGIVYLLIYSNLAWLFLVIISEPYSLTKTWAVSKILKNQFAFIFIHLLVIASLVVFLNRNYSPIQIGLIFCIFTPLFFLYRLIVYYLRKIVNKEPIARNFILIGRNQLSFEIRKFYFLNPEMHYRFMGYIDFDSNDFPLEKVQKFCSITEIHEIYCCAPNVSQIQLQQLINYGLDSLIKVKLILESGAQGGLAIQLEQYDKLPGFDIAIIPLDESRNQFLKRIFDIAFSSVFILLVMSWLVPLLTIIIKLDSKGPVFFIQDRSGKDNKTFKCMKFRTMVVNREADMKQATANDPRITKLGAFLRKTSIDELPQFINVFLGSMSVVGPRPHMLKHTVEYSKLIETFMGRHYVKPGITGLAQCLGYRGETRTLEEMENRVRLDRYYIENWTFWLDIKIIFLTVVSLIRGSDKAY
ncbi:MAG: exopolysaccharide biosynthesis polyprenyl glycosylphosphotransferase [Cytophagia bacterium]|nr:exopolysaccharide biosynthesis polyprenyl glycosylphosphotransferase [Cytophagia bacterium]NBW34960.1 exopolysaccharide biosynthesis polyprenyl glycosylphosphotransferase [Cytophagia bacterium]